MPLVNYESSDDESNEDNNPLDDKPQHVVSSTQVSAEVKTLNLLSKLPAPKSVSNNSTSLLNPSLNDMIADKPKSGPIKISVPSLKYFEEDDEEEEESRKAKRFKGSITGTGLSALLPKPKNTISTTSKALIPQSISRPQRNTSSAKRPISSTKGKADEESSEQTINYFFSDEKSDDLVDNSLILNDIEFGPKPDLSLSSSQSLDPNPFQSLGPKPSPSLDDITYKKLIASKFGEEAPEQINIVDIDVSKHLSDSKDWLKTISEEKEEVYTGVEPSSTAKRKHQITYLALQAKQREVELKNEWARNRTTKTQTRAKYGF